MFIWHAWYNYEMDFIILLITPIIWCNGWTVENLWTKLSLIMKCVTIVSYKIKIIGSYTHQIFPRRGLRQGVLGI
jgi:hypothetical protein